MIRDVGFHLAAVGAGVLATRAVMDDWNEACVLSGTLLLVEAIFHRFLADYIKTTRQLAFFNLAGYVVSAAAGYLAARLFCEEAMEKRKIVAGLFTCSFTFWMVSFSLFNPAQLCFPKHQ